jgi:hypothetical protein
MQIIVDVPSHFPDAIQRAPEEFSRKPSWRWLDRRLKN